MEDLVLESHIPSDFIVRNISNDSRKISKDSIFVAISGAKMDGHLFVSDALQRGASAVVCHKEIQRIPGVAYIRVKDPYSAYARLSEAYFDFPARSLELFGVTGTNGKTTSAFLMEKILSANALKTGLISTVVYKNGNTETIAERTTPEAWELQKLFHEIVSNGASHAVMEVSSHALDQNRIASAKFAGILFTNLTGDHLDYHGNMENYYGAKKILFTEHADSNTVAAINIDDPSGRRLAKECSAGRMATFGKSPDADCRIAGYEMSQQCTKLSVTYNSQTIKLDSPLIGEFNAYNLTGVVAMSLLYGISPDSMQKALDGGIQVPGRMERFQTRSGAVVFVDYAHTDDALERVLETLKKLKHKSLTAVFGCGGDRDRSKRPRMGAAASKFADRMIVTSDNPRTEDPELIINEIRAGIPDNVSYKIIPDRREAIACAISEASAGDIVLIAGKGHENYQEIHGVKYPFDDRLEVLRIG